MNRAENDIPVQVSKLPSLICSSKSEKSLVSFSKTLDFRLKELVSFVKSLPEVEIREESHSVIPKEEISTDDDIDL